MNFFKRKQAPAKIKGGLGSCLLTLFISGTIGLIVIVGLSLVAFDFYPQYQLTMGQGDVDEILRMGGGGLLMTIFGLFLLNGGSKVITAGRAIVEDEWGRQSEKRGCGAILNGLTQLFFGILCLAGGLGWITLTFYQEIIPWLGI